jgi:hypothetical protein
MPTATAGPQPTRTPAPTTARPATAAPTFTPTPYPTPTPETVRDPQLSPDNVHLFPWPPAVGDWLSVDVDPLYLDTVDGQQVTVTVDLGQSGVFTAGVEPAGLVWAPQARFIWIERIPEDAATLALTVTLHLPSDAVDPRPENNSVSLLAPIEPLSALAPPEPQATWAITETEGFRLHYLTGSAAERDIDSIVLEAQQAYSDVTRLLDGGASPVSIYLLDRVVGQGGYASSDWVAVSYVDRRYSPTLLGSVLRHELVHRLDGDLGCDEAPAMVREGLAVYLAGGHYRPEPIRVKAAALLETPRYVPLSTLVEGFYGHQHEIAYLEAGAVIGYLVDRLGWDRLSVLCKAAGESKGSAETDRSRWEAGLRAVDVGEAVDFEAAWQAWLEQGARAASDVVATEDIELELRLMDAMRGYQAALDPAAHFLEGILFSPAEAERLGVVADFVRRPRSAEAIALELALAMAQEAATESDDALLALLVEDIESALWGREATAGFVDDAKRIAAQALGFGWEPYHLLPESSGAYTVLVLDTETWPQQAALTARDRDGAWALSGVRLGD